jgi:hypothetical protein
MIWKGVFHDVSELQNHDLLENDEWVGSQVKKLRSAIKDPRTFKEENSLLLDELGKAKSIVDFGGSLAFGYMALDAPAEYNHAKHTHIGLHHGSEI